MWRRVANHDGDFLTHRREASRGRSKLDDLEREDIRHGKGEESDQDMRLVACELSILLWKGAMTRLRHYKEWLGGIDHES